MSRISIVVLCGLPGSGKTKFCQQFLEKTPEDLSFVHVDFDSLMPSDVEKELIEAKSEHEKSAWKQYRRQIQELLSIQIGNWIESDNLDVNREINIDDDLKRRFDKICGIEILSKSRRVVVLIDDNMYYRSMRYEYYQVARQHCVGFGQVFVNCSAETALARNSKREIRVPNDVIKSMAAKFEKPQNEEWEKHTFVIDDKMDGNFHRRMVEYFSVVMENPVQPLVEIDPQIQEESRIVCSENVIHQTDQILRKLVGEYMKAAKDTMVKEGLKKGGARVNQLRSLILAEMKNGKLRIDKDVEFDVKNAASDKESKLFRFVRNVFEERMKDIV